MSTLTRMISAGMNVCRLNFSHGSFADHQKLMKNIRAASKKTGVPIAILQDLAGPKIRVGELPGGEVELVSGSSVQLSCARTPGPKQIPVGLQTLYKDVRKGDRILLDDGLLEVEVQRVEKKDIIAKVIVGGVLKSNKGMNVPTARLSIATITDKDKEDLAFGLRNGVDIVSLSFVRSVKDVQALKTLVKRLLPKGKPFPLIVGKIEMREAVDDIDGILDAVDAVMIARGDLALQTTAAKVPVIQKTIIAKAMQQSKAVIVATEMLGSMVRNPRPTRAEISDVANAVIDHTDATMLSGESATGKYPVKSVQTMAAIITEAEASVFDDYTVDMKAIVAQGDVELSAIASLLARVSQIDAILVTRAAAHLAPFVRRFRPEVLIVVSAMDAAHARRLQLYWGIVPQVFSLRSEERAMQKLLLAKKMIKAKQKAVVLDVVRGHIEVREVVP